LITASRLESPALALGQQVALAVHRSHPTDWHSSRVAEIDESLVWVETPALDLEPAWPMEGDELFVRVARSDDAAYTLHARVVVVKTDPKRLAGLRVIGSSRSQQREYFRVPVSITTDEATLTMLGGSRFQATLHLRDLSATGVRAHCDTPVSIGDQIRMRLTLTGQPQPIELMASVVRSQERPSPAGTYWEVGAAFTNLASAIRERIVHFALSVQLEQRRRGTL
jgi:c-di-GMP-binding flagellar brake protein YcgR